jgi:transaldolase
MTSPIALLNEFGQSPWYDNLTRTLLDDGSLERLIRDDGIRGVTSNPTILAQAIATGDDAYRDGLVQAAARGLDPEAAYWSLVLPDIERAADLLLPVHEATAGADGFVSVEVSPELAQNTDATVEQAVALAARLARPNVMIKIPATRAGLPAITEVLAQGVNVNVTLIFSLDRYADVIDAYFAGVERFIAAKGDPRRLASVASFFVSRVDTETDRRLPDGHPLRGRAAVANARLAYEWFRYRFRGDQWFRMSGNGARVQRPLWASTSTKNPAYSPTLYVDELVGDETVNTLAPASIDALRNGLGHPRRNSIADGLDLARSTLEQLPDAGVDFSDVTATLEREGVDAFAASYREALDTVAERTRALTH